jgi:hypothetical protein
MSMFGLSGKQQRTILRYSHLLAGMLNVFFIYTPLGDVLAFQLLVRIILVPLIVITGVWMWQQARVRKLITKGLRQGEGQVVLVSSELVEGEKKLIPNETNFATKLACPLKKSHTIRRSLE